MYFFEKSFGLGESFFLSWVTNVPAIKKGRFMARFYSVFEMFFQIFITLCFNSPGAKRCFSLGQQRIVWRGIE